MQNSESYLTFFPGQGICLVPSAEGLLRVPKKEEAVPILEELSSVVLGDRVEENLSTKTQELYKTYQETFGVTDFKELFPPVEEPVVFTIPDLSAAGGTRISLNPKPVNWDALENHLKTLGYTLSKREYLNGALNDSCPVYVLSHAEQGVISEGKGIDVAQARRSPRVLKEFWPQIMRVRQSAHSLLERKTLKDMCHFHMAMAHGIPILTRRS
jgi:hypothetical protein